MSGRRIAIVTGIYSTEIFPDRFCGSRNLDGNALDTGGRNILLIPLRVDTGERLLICCRIPQECLVRRNLKRGGSCRHDARVLVCRGRRDRRRDQRNQHFVVRVTNARRLSTYFMCEFYQKSTRNSRPFLILRMTKKPQKIHFFWGALFVAPILQLEYISFCCIHEKSQFCKCFVLEK